MAWFRQLTKRPVLQCTSVTRFYVPRDDTLSLPMADDRRLKERIFTARMRTVWRVLSIMVKTICVVCFLIGFSMYWWPGIPSSPRPSEGRVYPLNNHGHYTYMNRQEYLLHETVRWTFPAVFLPFAFVEYFMDPLNRKPRWRPVVPPRPW